MSIRRAFQIVTIALALAFSFGAVSSPANACDPAAAAAGLC
jgi:uncharacterized membrane protein